MTNYVKKAMISMEDNVCNTSVHTQGSCVIATTAMAFTSSSMLLLYLFPHTPTIYYSRTSTVCRPGVQGTRRSRA
jgi:hypothetical protein